MELSSCHDPAFKPESGRVISGLEHARAVVLGEIPAAAMERLMGISCIEVAVGHALFRAVPGPEHLNMYGTVHGGFAATVLDTTIGCAIQTTLAPGFRYATIALNVTFVCPITADTGSVLCSGDIVHKGRMIRTADGRLTRERDGRLIAHASGTCMVLDSSGAA